MKYHPFFSLSFLCTAALLASAPPALAQFVASEVQVSSLGVVDPEFDTTGARFAWVDGGGSVWVSQVDPISGSFRPTSGKKVLVDTGAASVDQTGNGPEWVYTSTGAQLVYTGIDANGKSVIRRARLQNGAWVAETLPLTTSSAVPVGSLDANDPQPRIAYTGPDPATAQPVVRWRYLESAVSDTVVPDTAPPGGRWVVGKQAMVLSKPDATGRRQAFYYDIETGSTEQLTFDDGEKTAVFMWQAPDFNNEYIFFALTNDTEIRLYRKQNGIWTRIQTIKPPSANNYLWSPEYFVYKNKSYLFMVASSINDQKSNTTPTEVWLVTLGPKSPLYRRLSDSNQRVRKDPEVFFTSGKGPQLYVLEFVNLDTLAAAIFRLDTGIAP